jgi:GNAT superfamily N-acetyltransferase
LSVVNPQSFPTERGFARPGGGNFGEAAAGKEIRRRAACGTGFRLKRGQIGGRFCAIMSATSTTAPTRIEPACPDDLPDLTALVMELLEEEADFAPDRQKQQNGLQLILEQPNRGRIFVLRNDHRIIGMVNLLFTISTAEGGFVILMEDVIIHPAHRGQGYGSQLMDYVVKFAEAKGFKRITLLTDRVSNPSQRFFQRHGFTHSEMIPMRRVFAAEAT